MSQAETVAEPRDGVRDDVLAGRFFGARHRGAADALAAFLAADGRDAMNAWFGCSAPVGAALREAIDRDVAAIDALISDQLDAVLHHPRLRRLEGSWRGLAWLVGSVDTRARVVVRVLSVTWPEICRDLDRAAEFDQSQLFWKIYEAEFGTPGGTPYGIIVVDHEVRHRPAAGAPTDDVAALTSLAAIAAAAFAPMLLGASPTLFGVDAFHELPVAGDIAAPLRTADYARWRGLASRADMRFIGVTLPRVLARPLWEDDPGRVDGFRYAEYAPDASCRVWSCAAYAFAANAARAFARYNWPADVRGSDPDRVGGGVVTDLAREPFRTDPGEVWVRPSIETVLTDRQERALVDAGMIPLCTTMFETGGVFGAVRSLQLPATGFIGANAEAARANARLSTHINAMLCVSRFAHYLKVLGRELVGAFATAAEIETRLQRWLSDYVNASTGGGAELRSRFPLIDGRVTVRDVPGKPGTFGCIIHLQPHHQLDDVTASFRLTTFIADAEAKAA